MLAHEELRIRIRPIGTSRYLVTANGPATAAEVIAVDGEPAAFRDQWDQLISAELGLAPMGEQHTVAQLRGLGRGVFRLLFGERGEGIGACVGLALEQAQGMRPAHGLRLRFDLPEELRDLPLETLCAPPGQPQQSLALHPGYSVVRSLPGGPLGQRLPEPTDEPSLIRLLVACASPVDEGLPPLRPDAEVTALRQELPEVAVRTTVLERATRKSLETALGAHSPLPTALLLIAHGTYDDDLGKGVVALETEGGGVDRVPADLLSGMLLKAPGLRLVALNLCSGADSSLAEPFSGLAQALIGGGVPAVVAMRGRVSDVSAGQFSPELFKGLAANRTIDEAMGAARRRISHLPGHTAVEWATPALFLHESCRQGWLFKAREVRDDGGAVPDPLREGAEALRAFQRPVGHVDSTVLIGAARFQRDLGQWAQVQRTLRAETRQFEDEQRRLRAEAAFELAWEELEALCALLAAEEGSAAVDEQFEALRDALPGRPADCLTAEVERLRHLTGLAERARAAEESGDWAEAIARYEQLLGAHPAGLRDTASRLASARDELHVSEAFVAAERSRHGGDWASATAAYADVLARRPGHPGASAGAAYVGGRAAQDAGEWGPAEAGFTGCGGLADAAARAAYVRGRAAAQAREWEAARAAFAECVAAGGPDVSEGGVDDADALRLYAEGRLHQAASRWQDALACFSRLSSDLLDVPDRLLYARGRVADARAEWAGVIDGFGRLPDTYAHGEVRDRRRYARARVAAELRGDWSAVLSLLADVPDTGRAGTVGALRRKAEGRLAEATGDWATACEIYARGLPAQTPEARADNTPTRTEADDAAPDEEPRHLHLYALARTHELADAWGDALRAYEALPDGWADIGGRRLYARARIAECAAAGVAEWRGVVSAFSAVEAEDAEENGPFEDAADRRRYAQVRLAEAEGDWGRVREEAASLGEYRDAPALGAYARGRMADARQEWERAADAFRRCAGHRDADAHLAYAQGRLMEAAGRWGDAVAAYERAGGLDRAAARCSRLRRLLELLPWADGLTSAPLVADPFASGDPTYPYFALRDAGVDPGATMDAVNDASYTLLERGGMTWSERVAWDRLRLPARRLQLDALLYRWHSPAALRDAMAAISPDEGAGAGLIGDLCERFPQDAPLILLLARDREAAAAEWERRLAAAPGDMAVVHGLAAARLWQAQELEQSGAWEHAVTAWESALAYWATLLSDDAYWDGWRAERAACYERDLPGEDMAQLRLELSQHLFGQLSVCEQRHTEQERPEQAAAYQELAALLEAELGAARVLKDMGGLRDVPGSGAAPLACGPRYLRLLHLEAPLGALAAALDAAAEQGRDPGAYAVRELRWAFSELAQSFVLSEVHKFEPALRALPAFATLTTLPDDCAGPASAPVPAEHIEACARCQDFLHRNPAYVQLPQRHTKLLQDGVELAVRVRLALSRSALTDGAGGLDRARDEWAALVRVSRRAGMQARSKKAVVTAVLGRVEALVDRGGAQRGDCLDEAVTLVEAVPPALHPLDRELVDQLDAKLSALLSMRGVWRGYTRTKYGMRSDAYGAEADLRRALALNPASSHARDNLARALVFTLDAHTHTVPGRLKILHEALGLLDVGLGQALTHGYRETLGEALDEMERLLAQDLGVAGLRDLMRSDSEETPPDEGALASWAASLTDRAEEAIDHGDIRRALHHLMRATRADPTNSRIRRALLDAVRRRLEAPADSSTKEAGEAL